MFLLRRDLKRISFLNTRQALIYLTIVMFSLNKLYVKQVNKNFNYEHLHSMYSLKNSDTYRQTDNERSIAIVERAASKLFKHGQFYI